MLKRVFLALLPVLALSIHPALSSAQVATGAYALGTYDSLGADTINVGNLNVMLDIPVLHKAGRAGTNFTYDLFYNGSVWTPTYGAWAPDLNWGWVGNTQILTGSLTERTDTSSCRIGSRILSNGVSTTSQVTYHDKFGIAHWFNGTIQESVCTLAETDTLNGTWSTDHLYFYNYGIITDTHGVSFDPPVNSAATSASFTDANGNQISTDGAGHFTDTTGSTALTIAGSAPSNQTYTYVDASGTNRAVTISYHTYSVGTNFGCSGVYEYSASSVSLVDTITMPDSSTYHFTYESTPGLSGKVTGRLGSITLPAGGVITYTYTGANNGINCADGSALGITRTLSSATGSPTRTYTRTINATSTHTTVVNEAGTHLDYDFVHGTAATSTALGVYQTNLSVTTSGTGTPLLLQQTCYNSASLPCTTQTLTMPVAQVDQYRTWDGAVQNGSTTTYNNYGEATEVTTYDFGTATARGSSLTSDIRSYYGGFIASDTVSDTTGTISSTSYTYDSAALHSTSGIPQHTPGTNYGNLTQVSVATSASGYTAPLVTNYTYYDTGSLYSQTSPSGGVTTYSYDSTNTHTTTVTPPDPNSVGMGSTYTYDAYLGQPASATNPNGTVSSVTTSDGPGHPAQVVVAIGGTTMAKATSTVYPNQASTISYQGPSTTAETDTFYDNYGRPVRTATQSDSSNWYVTDTCYDAASRIHFKSYPYTATSLGSAVCTGAGDTYTYDALGRTLSVTHGDSPTTSVSYIYYGNATKVTNENNVGHIYQTDGAGRTTIVCELTSATMNGVSPTSCGTTYAGTGFATAYGYAGTTTTVTQGSQTRTFISDLAGRPLSKQEPEGNTTTYTYSSNTTGNVVTRQKPRPDRPAQRPTPPRPHSTTSSGAWSASPTTTA